MRPRLALSIAAVLLLMALPRAGWAAPGTVYLVLGSDTAVWNVPGGIDVAKYRNHFSPDLYTQPQNNAARVMDPAFRQQFADSLGHPLKLTWWMLVGSAYGQADNMEVPMANLMPLYLMRKYHSAAIRQLGDELTLHYHTFFWSDYNGDGIYYWNQARTFHECREDFDQALAQSFLEEEVFPVSFRSGWHFMDNEWQQYLNQLLPYSMDDDWPSYKAWSNIEPTFNVIDWSKAPSDFIPFHPASTNYQVPGDGLGWNVRSVKLQNVGQTLMNQIFANAAAGTNEVASLWGHLPETDFPTYLKTIDTLAHVAATNYPNVQFLYCTAVEAMQRWQGAFGQSAPELNIVEEAPGDSLTLRLQTSKPIFQAQPFVAVKDIFARFSIVPCEPAGVNAWTAVMPVPRSQIAKYGVAVTDTVGNLTNRIVRYLPEDVYVDNLDAGYQEASGQWTSITNAAWGTDARVVSLATNPTAQAIWPLPIARSGQYHAFAQVPAISNPAGQVQFDFYAGTSNSFSVFFSAPLPAKQWVYLGSPFLDQSLSNSIAMTVSAAGQTNAFAVADVIKLSPLTLPLPGFLTDVRIEPGETTANITWKTFGPATTLVEYGPSAGLGKFTVTNLQPVFDHAATLTGLTAGASCYFRAKSVTGELEYIYEGRFMTTNRAVITVPLFDITSSWKYTAGNLDGTGWEAAAYADSEWLGGPGLLWVDTRTGGPNPAVQLKNTQMPENPATHFPFTTYYFRKHFTFPVSTAGVTLTFSNYIDDGAIFYLNGGEIRRNNLAQPPTVISNSTLAIAYNCGSGDATCPVVFSVTGNALTNLVYGDNVLAVAVHNYATNSPDITFGSALSYSRPAGAPLPELRYLISNGMMTLYWNGDGFTVQRSDRLDSGANWTAIEGMGSPWTLTISNTTFFRLKK